MVARELEALQPDVVGLQEVSRGRGRDPITSWEVFDLPRCARRLDPRVLLRAELSTPWGQLQVFSTHTSRDDCQVRRVGEIVRDRRGPLPSIVTGDFNSVETLPVMAELRGRGFVDAFRTANPEAPGLTVWQRVAAPTSTVFRRVDYVFVLPGHQASGRVRASRVVLDTPGRAPDGAPLWPSDHYAVLADVDL
jgi:endonuclease/exonuclease/phosphatase family metal-dependent hydrolase